MKRKREECLNKEQISSLFFLISDDFLTAQRPVSYLAMRTFCTSGIHIKREQIQSTDSYQCVYDSGNPGHIAKNESYQIKTEETNQPPINGTDNGNGKSNTIQHLIIHNIYLLLEIVFNYVLKIIPYASNAY